jgi:ADP-ribosylglycohydrolase
MAPAKPSAAALVELARGGNSIEVDAYDFTNEELMRIAAALQPGTYLKINNSVSRSSAELSRIASATHERIIVA